MLGKIFTALTALLVVFHSVNVMASDEYTFAKLIERQPLKYPPDAAAMGWEGWAYYSFVISADGRVQDFKILDSNGLDKLNSALKKSIESSIYDPATYDGIPVSERSRVGRATFMLSNKPRGAGRHFLPRYRKLVKALESGEVENAWTLIQELESKEGRSLYEELYLQAQYVTYYALTGDKDREYLHALRVLDFYAEEDSKNYMVEPEFFTQYLVRIYQYEIAAMMLGDAFGSAEWLSNIAAGSEINDKIQAHTRKVRKSVEKCTSPKGPRINLKNRLLESLLFLVPL